VLLFNNQGDNDLGVNSRVWLHPDAGRAAADVVIGGPGKRDGGTDSRRKKVSLDKTDGGEQSTTKEVDENA
ncbi:hypothetical protein V5O48_013573, partial [Marasmius crinis-equi]